RNGSSRGSRRKNWRSASESRQADRSCLRKNPGGEHEGHEGSEGNLLYRDCLECPVLRKQNPDKILRFLRALRVHPTGLNYLVMPTATRVDPLSYLGDQINQLKEKGIHFRLRVLEDEQEPVCTFDGKKVINLASNNYLGLTTHPKLREAALEATRKYGVGSGAVRTNAGTVSAILGKEDFIISDELNHASIIDGARLSRAKILVFRHKDVAHAEEHLASIKDQPGRKLLITDGVFSMDGDIGPLPGLCDVAEKYGAIMMVDDAHSSGVLGKNGRGTIDHFNVHGRVDIQVGTLSKAIGAIGGYVCGSRDLIDFL